MNRAIIGQMLARIMAMSARSSPNLRRKARNLRPDPARTSAHRLRFSAKMLGSRPECCQDVLRLLRLIVLGDIPATLGRFVWKPRRMLAHCSPRAAVPPPKMRPGSRPKRSLEKSGIFTAASGRLGPCLRCLTGTKQQKVPAECCLTSCSSVPGERGVHELGCSGRSAPRSGQNNARVARRPAGPVGRSNLWQASARTTRAPARKNPHFSKKKWAARCAPPGGGGGYSRASYVTSAWSRTSACATKVSATFSAARTPG